MNGLNAENWAPRARFATATLRYSLEIKLITILPEPRQIEGNQQVLITRLFHHLSFQFSSSFAAIHHNSHDTGMTPPVFTWQLGAAESKLVEINCEDSRRRRSSAMNWAFLLS